MSSKKVLKKNFITKGIIFIFSFILRKYYLIYEDGDKIVLLRKGREYNISRVVK
ncbi:hypothetical protein LD85_2176 [Saccharolobus islandicus L.D.8.5]|nr:hypothetical protein LD85_1577 [Sulfolobus islandicus L.D.8.5]ADB87824.1 hypothetical protein LD85_2176 [Sulfolobus islandicus L.D.8.5]